MASSGAAVADSVRLAWPAEADQIAALQRRSWLQTLPPPAAQALTAALTAAAMTDTWRQAIERPPEATCRVLVAVAQERVVVGFATTVPSTDSDTDRATDGEVDQFVVDPAAQRRGHGSRLLNAAADTMRADGFVRALCWVGIGDDALRRFLSAAGWATDGAHREIGTEDAAVRLRQLRMHTSLAEAG